MQKFFNEGDYMDTGLRLFIAVNFPEDVKDQLIHIIREVKHATVSGNFTHRENLHITLAFIGKTTQLDEIKSAMDSAFQVFNAASFDLTLQGFGRFKRQEGDILWVGIEKNYILNEINKTITAELKKQGFKLDDKNFKPHLTIGRKAVVGEGFVEPAFAPIRTQVNRISLMKSEHINGKLTYTEIYAEKLKPKEIKAIESN